jgi:hypothetical protein
VMPIILISSTCSLSSSAHEHLRQPNHQYQ